jgi:FkbM family methyltransferase
MQAAIHEVKTANREFNGSSRVAASNPPAAITPEQFQVLTSAMEKAIENIVRQSQINEAIVRRLLALEKRVTEFANAAGAVARGTAATSSTAQAPAAAAPNAIPAGATNKDALPMYMGDSLAMCRVLNSFRMYVDTRDTMFTPQILQHGMWEPAITRVFAQSIKSGMTVVDVGANAGYYTLLAAVGVGAGGRVFAFEPEPRNLEILQRNLELNGVCDRVTLSGKAALNERKTLELHQNPRNRGAHTLFLADPAHSPFSRVKVETIALDDAIESSVDFMKIDAEGSEPLIFQGMKKLLARSPQLKILMEFNTVTLRNAGVDPAGFLALLVKMGFTVKMITPQATLVPAAEQTLLAQQLSTLFLTR